MKANRKFLKGDDEAVSPVIAVILMVAITVVLAATVYVWVSGFSGGGGATKSVALNSAGAIASDTKNYTISSATSGLKWSDLKYTLDGADLNYDGGTASDISSFGNGDFYVVDGGARALGSTKPSTVIDAGDSLVIKDSSLSGKTLRLIDSQSNSVILTQVIG